MVRPHLMAASPSRYQAPAVRYPVVPLLSEEPVGVQRLLQLAGEALPTSGV